MYGREKDSEVLSLSCEESGIFRLTVSRLLDQLLLNAP